MEDIVLMRENLNMQRILEKSNKKACKELKNYYESSIKLCEEIDKILEELKEQGLIDINI